MKSDQHRPLVSHHFPYIPIQIGVRHREESVEALLDTGFDGDVILPEGFIGNGDPADDHLPWRMANESIIHAPAYWGWLKIGKITFSEVLISVLGNKTIIGRQIIKRFKITIDHGKRVIVE